MIDMPPVSPPAHEQIITQKLLTCGLRNGGFTVRYENDLQSVEIVIGKKAGASAEHFDCITKAADNEIVTFKDANLHQAYQDRVFDTLRPKMLADARVELEKRGVLDGFPERSKFGSDKLFAEALERQCGMSAGSFFIESKGSLIGQPKLDGQSKADENAMACLMAALMYVTAKGESFKFGFIGNEASSPEK
jgi:hypothetical protein